MTLTETPSLTTFHEQMDHRWFNSHRYALIDAVWRDELPKAWPITVIAPAFLGPDTDRCPVLLDLHALAEAALCELMDHVQQQVLQRQDALCSLLLAASVEPPALAQHLAVRMKVRPPGAATPQQFRYFDPGTWLQLPRLLGPRGLDWLLGPVRSAVAPWAGGWTLLLHPPREQAPFGFRLQPAHFAALQRLGVVNRQALAMPPPDNAVAWEQRCAVLDAQVLRALAEHGLSHAADLLAFAGHATDCHPRFDQHPRLQAVFHTLRSAQPHDELDYRELTGRITPDAWQAIATDLGAAASTPESIPERPTP